MSPQTPSSSSVLGVILAGGQGQRMGCIDKSSLVLGGRTLLERVCTRAAPQVDRLLLNMNGPTTIVAETALTVVSDSPVDSEPAGSEADPRTAGDAKRGPGVGPLAGIVAAMRWSRDQHSGHLWLATFAVDTPFLPLDFVDGCLRADADATNPLYACSGERQHYAMALWPVGLLGRLEQALKRRELALGRLLRDTLARPVDFATGDLDPFFNINTPEDLRRAELFLRR